MRISDEIEEKPSIKSKTDFIKTKKEPQRKPLKRIKKAKVNKNNDIVIDCTERVKVALVYE